MQPTNVRKGVLFMLVMLSVITYLDRVCINAAAPAMREELGLSPSQLGTVFSAFALAYALFEIPGGWMGDRFGPRIVLTRIVVWWSAFTALTGVVTGYIQLLSVRFLFGMGEAGAYPNTSSAISRWFPTQERARSHGWVWMASRLGGAVSPLVVAPLIVMFGWRSVFYLFSTFGVVWAVVWWTWFRNTPRAKPSVNQAEIELIGAPAVESHSLDFRRVMRSKNLWLVMAMYHFYCYGAYWYLTWTMEYLQQEKGFDTVTAANFTALPFVLGAIANFIGGYTSDSLVKKLGLKWGRRIVGAGGVGLAGVLMFASLGIQNAYVAAVMLAAAFAASDFMLPNCWAVCLDIGKESAGAITGAMNSAGQVGSTIVSLAYGWMVESYGWNYPLAWIAGMSLISAALWFFIDPTEPLSAERQPLSGQGEIQPELAA
ncbi:MAG: MFS transporter [Bryobacterales bacterium]